MIMVTSIGLLCTAVGFAVYFGNTFLLPEQIQKRVKDKKGYGRAMGSLIIGLGLAIVFSGFYARFGARSDANHFATRILLTAMIIDIILFILTQIKYNGRISG